jgi:hypothetical protein
VAESLEISAQIYGDEFFLDHSLPAVEILQGVAGIANKQDK